MATFRYQNPEREGKNRQHSHDEDFEEVDRQLDGVVKTELPSLEGIDQDTIPDELLSAYFKLKEERGEDFCLPARIGILWDKERSLKRIRNRKYQRARYPANHKGLLAIVLCNLAIEGFPLQAVAKRVGIPYRWLSRALEKDYLAVEFLVNVPEVSDQKIYLDALLYDFDIHANKDDWGFHSLILATEPETYWEKHWEKVSELFTEALTKKNKYVTQLRMLMDKRQKKQKSD